MIYRLLSKEVLTSIEQFPSVAILGARQTGKTTLAKSLLLEVTRETLYIDLEDSEDLNRLSNPQLFFTNNQDKCIILDEIQRMPELFPLLRSYIDRYRIPGRFILLGSANPHLLKLTSETLAGRIVYTELTGINILEVSDIFSTEVHWLRGGFPEPLQIEDDDRRNKWHTTFLRTITERDIPLMGLTISTHSVWQCLQFLAYLSGNVLRKSNLTRDLELTHQKLSLILDYLESAYLIRRLMPYYINISKRLVKSPKVYLRDSGLLHSVLSIRSFNDMLGNPICGHSWEGYTIEQIISVLGQKFEYFFYRTQDGTECDLLLCRNSKPLACIEMKITVNPKRTKSLTTAIRDLRTKNNFIIVPHRTDSYQIAYDLMVCDLHGFFNEIKKLASC